MAKAGLNRQLVVYATISLRLPVYNIMTAFGNLFGIGGSSMIARALGTGDSRQVQTAFSLTAKGAFITSVCYGIL